MDSLIELENVIGKNCFVDLQSSFHQSICNNDDVDIVSENWYDYFTSCVKKAFETKLPKNKVRGRAPWLDSECVEKRKELLECYNDNHNCAAKHYKAFLQMKKRQYKQKLLQELDENLHKNPTEFWKTFKSVQIPDNSTVKMNPEKVCEKLKSLSQMLEQDYFDKIFEHEIKEFINMYDDGLIEKTFL